MGAIFRLKGRAFRGPVCLGGGRGGGDAVSMG